MGRTNMEDSLRTDGHLGKLARFMGWCESKAGGRLWFFYRHTQADGIVTDTVERITSSVLVDFDDEAEVAKWCAAMVAAKLGTWVEPGRIYIHGNEKHIERIANLKGNASKGGKASQAAQKVGSAQKAGTTQNGTLVEKVNDYTTVSLANGRASAEHSGTLLTPGSLLPSSSAPATSASAPEAKTLSLARETAHKEVEDRPQLPLSNDLRTLTMQTTTMAMAMEVFELYQDEREKRRQIGRVLPMSVNSLDRDNAKRLYVLCGGDMKLVRLVIRAFLGQEGSKGWWKNHRWALRLLVEEDGRNFEICRGIAGEAGVKQQTQVRTV